MLWQAASNEGSFAGRAAPWQREHWRHRLQVRAGGLVQVVLLWIDRARQRRALAELEDRRLVDIARSRAEVRRECAKPFWRT